MLGVAGLVIGAVSVVAFISPLLWFLPLLGFTLSALGLWRIHHSELPMSGRRVAVLGLLLSTLFGVAAPARVVIRDWVLTRRAQQFTDAWFEHVQNGRLYAAHQMTLPERFRMPLDDSLEHLYETDAMNREDYGKFLTKAPMDVLAAQWKGMQVHHVMHTGSTASFEADSYGELYDVVFAPGSNPAKARVIVMVVRSLNARTGAEEWRIEMVGPGENIGKL
jgi:hypothetical protein